MLCSALTEEAVVGVRVATAATMTAVIVVSVVAMVGVVAVVVGAGGGRLGGGGEGVGQRDPSLWLVYVFARCVIREEGELGPEQRAVGVEGCW